MTTNDEMVAYWAERAGPEWVANEDVFDHELEPFGRAVLDALALQPGESVLDIGCGFGSTSIDAARAVGEHGRVVGVDVSPAMVQRAEERVRELGLRNVSFVLGDAQVHRFDRPVDTVVSRFGVMFFADPVAAFANIHAVVRPGGRLAFVCWQAPSVNPWFLAPLEAWTPFLPSAPAAPSIGVPGPFGFADDDRIRDVLSQSGWSDVSVTSLPHDVRLGGRRGVEGAVQQMLASSAGRSLRDQLPPDRFGEAMDALRNVLQSHLVGDDVVFPGAVWIVTAVR